MDPLDAPPISPRGRWIVMDEVTYFRAASTTERLARVVEFVIAELEKGADTLDLPANGLLEALAECREIVRLERSARQLR